ncbi:MAG: Gldg family protein [Chloroflexi bacterium]|nr:Gldg family protein [Chloroflexota bacterium]
MRSLIPLVKKDLRGYFDQPTGYILIVIFVGVISYLFFFVSAFNRTSEASARDLFTILPWLLAVFIPASTMRLLAEEQRDGTLEILLTQPIRGWVVLAAKFIAGMVFVSVAILATVGIPIALETVGNVEGGKWNLDEGAVVAQYLGSLFLAASFVSVGLFTSSLTQNQIVSFILGLFFIAALMLVGLDVVTEPLPDRFSRLVQDLSPVTHFASMARGVIDLRDILYFGALVSTFLSATFLAIRSKSLSHQSPQYRNLQLGVAGLIVLSVLVGWFSSSIGGRVDLTEDKLYTLSGGTEDILAGLDDILTVKLFSSKDPPQRIITTTRDVNDFLDDLAAGSSRVKLVRRYPDTTPDPGGNIYEDKGLRDLREAQMAGIPPRQFESVTQGELQIKVGYLGITITYADRREVIRTIDTIDGLEYRIASLVYKMSQTDRKTVAFLSGNGERSIEGDFQTLAAVLGQQYDITEVAGGEEAPPDLSAVDVLIIPGPTREIPAPVVDALAAFLDGGGKAMVMVDRVIVDRARLQAKPNRNSFADFVNRYGVIVDDNLLFDMGSNERITFSTPSGSVLAEYPYWMRVTSVDAKISGEISRILMPWASSVAFDNEFVGRVDMLPLLQTSGRAAVDYNYRENPDVSPGSQAIVDVTEGDLVPNFVGVAVTGKGAQTGGDGGVDEFRLIVTGDSDWLADEVVSGAQENLAVVLNLVDWLAQEDALASIRSKIVTNRQLLFPPSSHRNTVQYANIIGVPLAFVLIGLLRFLMRRGASLRRYGREE